MTTPDALTVLRELLERDRVHQWNGVQWAMAVTILANRLEREQAEAKYPPLKPRSGR